MHLLISLLHTIIGVAIGVYSLTEFTLFNYCLLAISSLAPYRFIL
jgi:hypothetical protein